MAENRNDTQRRYSVAGKDPSLYMGSTSTGSSGRSNGSSGRNTGRSTSRSTGSSTSRSTGSSNGRSTSRSTGSSTGRSTSRSNGSSTGRSTSSSTGRGTGRSTGGSTGGAGRSTLKNNSGYDSKGKNPLGKNKKKKRKKRSKFVKILRGFFLVVAILFFIALIMGAIAFGIFYHKYAKMAKETVKKGGEAAFKNNVTSVIYDAQGNVITDLVGAHDTYYIDSEEIPYYVKSAFITTEDRNFYKHSGVDVKAVARAFYELVKNKGTITQGGSTITQQLARNIFLSHEVTWDRKVREMFIAREIEKEYSKDQILEFYINNIYFGNGYYGIEAASRGYFSKSVTDLSLAEIAYLCSIPNNPTMYDPFTNNEATAKRKNRILKQMYDQGDIDKEMYDEAVYATIVLTPEETDTQNNYVETYVRHCATECLMQNAGFELKYTFENDEEEEAYIEEYNDKYTEISNKLYTGGYNIYTSIDMEAQAELQAAVDENLSYYTETDDDGVYTFQGAATCIDNSSGKVVAIVGGRTQDYNGYTLNRAYQSYRQPGSSIKPLIDYIPAFERGYTPESTMVDEEIEDGPVNSPNVYDGTITLRYAIKKSKNTIAWKLFGEIGFKTCLDYLKEMNFEKITDDDYVAAASIGGLTYGVSTLEMASAYSAIENDGTFRTPTCISKITDLDGNIIVDNVSYGSSKSTTVQQKKVYETEASRMMISTMKDVLTSGTGKNYNIDDAICAAKTGTTNSNKDVWFVGFSKYYTTAVWSGYDLPQEIDDGVGTKCSGSVWQQFMSEINSGLDEVDFPDYGGNDDDDEDDGGYYEEETSSDEQASETSVSESTTVSENASSKETTKTAETTAAASTEAATTEAETSEAATEQATTSGEPENTDSGGAGGGDVYQENW